MTGVMLAIPAANYVFHNSLFLVAHFHNVIIGGSLFGYFAGLAYWWPKATGFKLNETLGKWACGLWTVGFFMAFMPLYVLGFMGMTRRLNYYDNPEWNTWLLIAGAGALVVLCGILVQLYQIFASIRDREQNLDLTGDPWGGRTLEWSTSSPPPFYNFAKLPQVRDRDHWQDMKDTGLAHKKPESYAPIHMPSNTWCGVVIGGFSMLLGMAMVWHIWWAAIVGLLGIMGSFIVYTFEKGKDYYVPVDQVKAIEAARYEQLAHVNDKRKTDEDEGLAISI